MAPNATIIRLLLLSITIVMAACSRPVPTTVPAQNRANPARQATETPKPEVTMQYTYQATPDSLHLYFQFSDASRLMELRRSAKDLSYELKDNATRINYQVDTVKLQHVTGAGNADDVFAKISIPAVQVKAVNMLHLKLWQQFAGQTRMHTVFRVPLQPYMLNKTGLLVLQKTGMPLMQRYITTTDTLVLQASDTTKALVLHRFSGEFPPALPPMSAKQETQPRALIPQDSIVVQPGQTFKLQPEGLYLLWPRQAYARGLLVKQWHYPQVTMTDELLQPLIYITTSTEREQLLKAPDPKKAVDDFWLGIAGEKQLARELIRTYYGRVEHANKLYTSHKPGWATDRGMIYLVYGPPTDISRVGSTETWIYRETEMQLYVKFVFTKKENNFTENHYELVRRREYEESWYGTVAKWRAGITDM